jgi:hypothetical protein
LLPEPPTGWVWLGCVCPLLWLKYKKGDQDTCLVDSQVAL